MRRQACNTNTEQALLPSDDTTKMLGRVVKACSRLMASLPLEILPHSFILEQNRFMTLPLNQIHSPFKHVQPITLTVLHHTIPYSRKVENWCKSDYVIKAGPIYIWKRWLGSVTCVAWRRCSRYWGARGPRLDSGGNRPLMGCQLKMKYAR